RGEDLRLHVVVKNVGDGKSYETLATLSDKSGEGLDVEKGRFNVNDIAPGESKAVDFTFSIAGDYKGDSFSLQMDVYDQTLHEYVTEKLTFPVSSPTPVAQASGTASVTRDGAPLL